MNETQYWWACPNDGMNFNQLQFLKNIFEKLKLIKIHGINGTSPPILSPIQPIHMTQLVLMPLLEIQLIIEPS
jgi:hypothetical protein